MSILERIFRGMMRSSAGTNSGIGPPCKRGLATSRNSFAPLVCLGPVFSATNRIMLAKILSNVGEVAMGIGASTALKP